MTTIISNGSKWGGSADYLKRFSLTFTGREVGAIGIFSRFTVTVEAATPEAALGRLYDTHEHIRLHSITELSPRCLAALELAWNFIGDRERAGDSLPESLTTPIRAALLAAGYVE